MSKVKEPAATTVAEKRTNLRKRIVDRYVGDITDARSWAIETGGLLAEYIDLGLETCKTKGDAGSVRAESLSSITDQLREDYGTAGNTAPQEAVAVYWTHKLGLALTPSADSTRLSLRALRIFAKWVHKTLEARADEHGIVLGFFETWTVKPGLESTLKRFIEDQATKPIGDADLRHNVAMATFEHQLSQANDLTGPERVAKVREIEAERAAYLADRATKGAAKVGSIDPTKMSRDEAIAFGKALLSAHNLNAIAGLIKTLEPMTPSIMAMLKAEIPAVPATVPFPKPETPAETPAAATA